MTGCPLLIVRDVAEPQADDAPFYQPVRCDAPLALDLWATRTADEEVRPCFDVDGGYFATRWRVVCAAGHVILVPDDDDTPYDPSWLETAIIRAGR